MDIINNKTREEPKEKEGPTKKPGKKRTTPERTSPPEGTPTEGTRQNIINIPLEKIIEPATPMRINIEGTELKGLTESIRRMGLIHPIIVRKKKEKYEIIAGMRRFYAHKTLLKDTIQAIEVDLDDKIVVMQRYAENIERADVPICEEAVYLSRLQKTYALTQNDLAKLLSKSVSYINERLSILNYTNELFEALRTQKITFSVARELVKVKVIARRNDMLNYAIENGCNARTMRKWREDVSREEEGVLPEEKESLEKVHENYEGGEKYYVQCVICKGRFEVEETILIRVCKKCFNQSG